MRELITDEMVEAAARASYTDWARVLWGRADDYTKRVERSSVRAALEAVAPLIAALGLREERRPGATTTLNDSAWTRPDKRRYITDWEETPTVPLEEA